MCKNSGRIRERLRRVFPIFAVLLSSPVALVAQDAERPISVVGHFSNMRLTEEHAYGYSVELWRQGDLLLGFFLASEGLQGDTPTGLLGDLKHDAKTGALSFRARLSIGVVYSQEHDGVPSRDVFEFAGILGKHRLAGTLQRLDALCPRDPPRTEKVVLLRSKSNDELEPYKSLADWRKSADEILKFRGPKW